MNKLKLYFFDWFNKSAEITNETTESSIITDQLPKVYVYLTPYELEKLNRVFRTMVYILQIRQLTIVIFTILLLILVMAPVLINKYNIKTAFSDNIILRFKILRWFLIVFLLARTVYDRQLIVGITKYLRSEPYRKVFIIK